MKDRLKLIGVDIVPDGCGPNGSPRFIAFADEYILSGYGYSEELAVAALIGNARRDAQSDYNGTMERAAEIEAAMKGDQVMPRIIIDSFRLGCVYGDLVAVQEALRLHNIVLAQEYIETAMDALGKIINESEIAT